jgi:nucleoside-diphosphate-sugar epimerase
MNHTILGAGGSVGNSLTNQLLKTHEKIRLVSRSKYLLPGTESIKADISSYEETLNSIRGSDIVYMCVGLPYDSKLWMELWPKMMKNVIDACKGLDAKLIFFDNAYMYGKVDGKMVETTPYNPCSKKGEVRAKTVMMLEYEISRNNINAIIARSADLYGPYSTETSILYLLAIEKYLKGKSAQWLIDINKYHSFTYTIDSANGMIMLANCPDCSNQTWHLPTYPPLDGETLLHMIAKEIGTYPYYSVLNRLQFKLISIFDKTVAESYEMLYQSEFTYYFDSTKFNTFFDYKPKSYYQGIHDTIEFLKTSRYL